MAKIISVEALKGKFVNLREVTTDDAEFILKLRCDEKKSRFLHKTEYNVEKQVEYIKNYLKKDNEWYFIIENKEYKPLGTVRIYDVEGDKYTGGSWLMIDGASPKETIEGDLLLKEYSFNVLNFSKNIFQVSKGNNKVIRYHKICGAEILSENDLEYNFLLTKEMYIKNRDNLMRILGK